MERPAVQKMVMPIGKGHVTVEMPWDLTDDEMKDVIDCIEIMRKVNARVRERRNGDDLHKSTPN